MILRRMYRRLKGHEMSFVPTPPAPQAWPDPPPPGLRPSGVPCSQAEMLANLSAAAVCPWTPAQVRALRRLILEERATVRRHKVYGG